MDAESTSEIELTITVRRANGVVETYFPVLKDPAPPAHPNPLSRVWKWVRVAFDEMALIHQSGL